MVVVGAAAAVVVEDDVADPAPSAQAADAMAMTSSHVFHLCNSAMRR